MANISKRLFTVLAIFQQALSSELFDPPEILNLQQHINSFFVSKVCVILIDNYIGIPIPSNMAAPIILRKPIYGETLNEYYPISFQNLTDNTARSILEGCPVSPFFLFAQELSNRDIELCFKLNYFKYSANSKPWQCVVHISIPIHVNNIPKIDLRRQIPNIVGYTIWYDNFQKMLPSSIPSLVIIVTSLEDEDMGGHIAFENMGIAAKQQLYDGGSQVSHKIFLQFITQKYQNTTSSGILMNSYPLWWIQSIRIFCVLCFEWSKKRSEIESNNPISLTELEASAFPERNSIILWNFDGYDGDKTSSSFINGINACKTFIGTNPSWIQIPDESVIDRWGHAQAHLWTTTILTNYTYEIDWTNDCLNGKIVPSTFKSGEAIKFSGGIHMGLAPLQAPLYLQSILNRLRFISCGRPELAAFAFEELINVYDIYVWAFTSLCSAVAVAILSIVVNVEALKTLKEVVLRQLEYILTILLEQDNPPPQKDYMRKAYWRIFMTGFVLATLVLRNAYKSDNVYNMILPRKVVPLKSISQLVADNFTVYTVINYVNIGWNLKPPVNLVTLNDHKISEESDEFRANSEVASFGLSNQLIDNLVINHTKISERVIGELKNLLDLTLAPFYSNDSSDLDRYGYSEKVSRQFWMKQKEVVFNQLSKCNRVAFVMPTYQSFSMAKRLKQGSNSDEVYVGAEQYFSSFNVFDFEGNIPGYLIARTRQVHSSGLFEWWQRTVLYDLNLVDNTPVRTTPPIPSMEGNILVIFSVMWIGQAISCFCLVVENWNRIFYKFREYLKWVVWKLKQCLIGPLVFKCCFSSTKVEGIEIKRE